MYFIMEPSRPETNGFAPKGQQDSAQGFNPGLGVLKRCVLKGHQIRRSQPERTSIFPCANLPNSGATFRAHPFEIAYPGLKPRAESLSPFGTKSPPPIPASHAG
jgi:hypothetical protein